jgi:[acyl-carrier-protein] S-malonyltransferase
MKRAFVFPGQGSQAVGMGRDLAAAYPAARQVFETVDEALNEKLSLLMFDGPEAELTLTQNAQPALMAVSLAVVRVLEQETGKPISALATFVAGHSLGEYAALAAAGAIEIADAARLLRQRGLAMQKAVPVGEGAMAALLGLDLEPVRQIVAEAAAATGLVCDVANDNASGQVVVSGAKAAVEKAIEIGALQGARRSILLPVSAPFHCALMAPAADVMADALSIVRIARPTVPVVANVTAAAVTDPAEIRRLLVEQVTGLVRWRESVLFMKAQGVDRIAELGSGKVLSGLVRRIDKDVAGVSIQGPGDIGAFIASL